MCFDLSISCAVSFRPKVVVAKTVAIVVANSKRMNDILLVFGFRTKSFSSADLESVYYFVFVIQLTFRR